jgi:hypothetical protein
MLLAVACTPASPTQRPPTALPSPTPFVFTKTNLAVQVNEAANEATSSPRSAKILTVKVGKPDPLASRDLDNPEARVILSPDGQWQAQWGNSGASSGTDLQLSYGRIGSAPTTLTVQTEFQGLSPIFSPDSQYLSYSIGSMLNNTWQLYVIDVRTGARKVFDGKLGLDNPPSKTAARGIPAIVGWNPDGKRALLVAYGLEGAVDPIFEVDLSSAPFAPTNEIVVPVPFPAIKFLLPAEQGTGSTSYFFSDDYARLAYSYADPTRAVPNYAGFRQPQNTIGVLNVADGTVTAIIPAPADEAIASIAWVGDSNRLLYSSVKYSANPSANPTQTWYSFDVTTKQTLPGVNLERDSSEFVDSVIICGETVYYGLTKTSLNASNGPIQERSLHTTTLADLTKRGPALLKERQGYSFTTLACVP